MTIPQPVNGPVTDLQDSPEELVFWLDLLRVPRKRVVWVSPEAARIPRETAVEPSRVDTRG